MLQLRAAYLSEDDRISAHWSRSRRTARSCRRRPSPGRGVSAEMGMHPKGRGSVRSVDERILISYDVVDDKEARMPLLIQFPTRESRLCAIDILADAAETYHGVPTGAYLVSGAAAKL